MASCDAVLLAILLIAVPVYSENYVVNWDQGVSYDTWGSDKTVNVGDTLEFKYGATHSVIEVSSDDYSACSSSNTPHNDMDTTITLSTPGAHYFICGTSGHCVNGMKLAVTVSGGSTGSPSTPPPIAGDGSNSPPVVPSSPTTPSSPNTPSYPGTPSKNGGAMLRVDTTLLKVLVLLVVGGLVVLG